MLQKNQWGTPFLCFIAFLLAIFLKNLLRGRVLSPLVPQAPRPPPHRPSGPLLLLFVSLDIFSLFKNQIKRVGRPVGPRTIVPTTIGRPTKEEFAR